MMEMSSKAKCMMTAIAGLAILPGFGAPPEWVEGTTHAMERITISSPVEEIVGEVMVKEGDVVEKGAVLAQLLSNQEVLEAKRLDQLVAKAQFSYDATLSLFEKKIESKETLLEKKAELDSLKIEREIAQAKVDERRILAPISGTVVYRLKDPGESIGRVEPIFEMIDVSRLKLMFFLSSEYLNVLQDGMECEVEFPEAADRTGLVAKLTFVDPQVDARSGLFRVRFQLDNSEAKIKPGIRVRLKLPKAGE